MIRLRMRPPTPASLKSKGVEVTKEQIENKIKSGTRLKSNCFIPHWKREDIKEALWELQHGKCCYCERKLVKKREPDVDHFRPKAGIAGEDHPGYWWLAYKWENLFLACKSCNQEYKQNHFPLLPGGKRAFTGKDDLTLEKPVLVHPIDDHPEELIIFDCTEENKSMVKAMGADEEGRGRKTVGSDDIKGLTAINNKEVMMMRSYHLNFQLKPTVELLEQAESDNDHEKKNRYRGMIKAQTAADKPFAGFSRAFFRAKGLGEYVSTD